MPQLARVSSLPRRVFSLSRQAPGAWPGRASLAASLVARGLRQIKSHHQSMPVLIKNTKHPPHSPSPLSGTRLIAASHSHKPITPESEDVRVPRLTAHPDRTTVSTTSKRLRPPSSIVITLGAGVPYDYFHSLLRQLTQRSRLTQQAPRSAICKEPQRFRFSPSTADFSRFRFSMAGQQPLTFETKPSPKP